MRLTKKLILHVCLLSLLFLALALIFFTYESYTLMEGLERDLQLSDIHSAAAHEKVNALILLATAVGTVCFIIFLVLIFYLINRLVLPLGPILDFSRRLALGDFSTTLKVKSKDELGELTRALNHMKDRLQHSIVKMRNSYEREKKARSEAERANSMKTEFLHNVSQELRTPLNPILSLSDVILGQVGNGRYDEMLAKKIRVIRESAENMLGIISTIKELSRLEKGKVVIERKEFETGLFVKELLDVHQPSITTKQLIFKNIYAGNFPKELKTDRDILFHILSNILAYCIQYAIRETELVFAFEEGRKDIVFSVRATASSPSEMLGQLFSGNEEKNLDLTPYLTNARLLGLVSAVSNAQLINGKLEVEFDESTTQFKLSLPKDACMSIGTETSSIHTASNVRIPIQRSPTLFRIQVEKPQAKGGSRQIKVLVFDEDKKDVQLIEKTLTEAGMTCKTTRTQEECLKSLVADGFDLLLVDTGGKTGLATLSAIRSDHRHDGIPVIVMNSSYTQEQREELLRLNVKEYLVKPVQTRDLLQAISSQV